MSYTRIKDKYRGSFLTISQVEGEGDYFTTGDISQARTIIQESINKLATQGGGTLLIKKGNYNLDDTSINVLSNNILILGEGNETQLIQTNENVHVFNFGDNITYFDRCGVKNLKVLGTGNSGTGNLINLNYVKYGIFRDLSLNNAPNSAIYMNNKIRYCTFDNIQGLDSQSYSLTMINSLRDSNSHNKFVNVKLSSSLTYALWCESSNNDFNSFINCDFQSRTNSDILKIGNGTSNKSSGWKFTNCEIYNEDLTLNNTYNAINLIGCEQFTFIGCTIRGTSSSMNLLNTFIEDSSSFGTQFIGCQNTNVTQQSRNYFRDNFDLINSNDTILNLNSGNSDDVIINMYETSNGENFFGMYLTYDGGANEGRIGMNVNNSKTDYWNIERNTGDISSLNGARIQGYSKVSSGSSTPSNPPENIGDIYIDTSLNKVYISSGTSSISDWRILN